MFMFFILWPFLKLIIEILYSSSIDIVAASLHSGHITSLDLTLVCVGVDLNWLYHQQ